jgi:hypothetical protein
MRNEQIKVIKLEPFIKNAKKIGYQIYLPIVKINNDYFFCEGIKSTKKLNINNIDILQIKPKKIIEKKYYKINNINI